MLGQDKVFEPGPNRIFVFGSNLAGIHASGAAKDAYKKYGAIWGQGDGLQGQSYAIPTKDEKIITLPIANVQQFVDEFMDFAWQHQELYFFVTRIGCGLAGYTDAQIAPMFTESTLNVELPHGWRG